LSGYADTSFLVSLYIPDSNSVAAAARMQHLPLPLFVTSLGELELMNALQLRLFRREIGRREMREAHAAFRADARDGVLAMKPLSEGVYAQARRLASKWTPKLGTRTLDIVHVASAVVLKADSFHTFDGRQKRLARAVGLATQ
jgi:predicted nucleic acid-binding protein